jgi:RNA polymerase sigma factor (sigma-70 family)
VTTFAYPSSPSVDVLYTDHHAWLKSWLYRRLGNAPDAADLAHDVFVRLILKPAPNGFEHAGGARTYLRKMAQGMCINLWHRKEIEQAWLDTLAAQPEACAPSAECEAMVRQALNEIASILRDVSPKASQAFLMASVCQMPTREVAAELGISSRMVRKYIAQVMLRCLLAQAADTAAYLGEQSRR